MRVSGKFRVLFDDIAILNLRNSQHAFELEHLGALRRTLSTLEFA